MRRVGKQTIVFQNPPGVLGAASVVGPKEGKGPLKETFDVILPDSILGEKSWEKAECRMLQEAQQRALEKAGMQKENVDFLLAGDLLNQTISANFAARTLGIPFLGLYGACSTMMESLLLAAVLVDGDFAGNVIAAAVSHHDTAERQFRFPTELGTQRPLSAQWTVTGAGAVVVGKHRHGICITHATPGKVVDLGQKDSNDMGAAMAPAAADTLITHLQDLSRQVTDYDLILTGDLGAIGKNLTENLIRQQGFSLGNTYSDCGLLIFDPSQDTHAGGSGCGCSAVVTCGYVLREMESGRFKRVLILGTGALHSPTSLLQGESIPGIAHGVVLENIK